MRIKICGIILREDALGACEAGADALGFIFWQGSKRYIDPDEAKKIVKALPPFVTTVGVFVDERHDKISEIIELVGLDVVQLHGTEPPEFCDTIPRPVIKAFRVTGEEVVSELSRYNVSAYLLDTYREGVPGGTGKTFNWDLALEAKKSGKPIILSGGLHPGNVAEAIEKVRPYAVDVASGVEKEPGRKDYRKMEKFVKEARL